MKEAIEQFDRFFFIPCVQKGDRSSIAFFIILLFLLQFHFI